MADNVADNVTNKAGGKKELFQGRLGKSNETFSFDRDVQVNLFDEPEYGTTEYMDAQDHAAEKLPNDYKITRYRVAKVDYESVTGLISLEPNI